MTRKLTSRVLQQRYDVCDRTIDRWTAAGILPEPMRINKIRYWDEEQIEQLERARMAKALAAAGPEGANFRPVGEAAKRVVDRLAD